MGAKGRNRGQVAASGMMAAMLAGGAFAAPIAQAREATFAFAIAGGTLQEALVSYAATSGVQLLYASDLVAGRAAPPLVGGYSAETGLVRLLAGSGLVARRVKPNVYVIEPAGARYHPVGLPGGGLAAASTSEEPGMATPPVVTDPLSATAELSRLSPEIVVTGTHIRGGNPGAPPVQRITRDDLARQGYATVAQALQALPGNFSGTASEQSGLAFADTTGTNATLATGVNLRALGAGATLVLVNGQRIAGSGTQGAFGDVSNIPSGALDRVEVLLDGASAIYGSDAVGGVVNVLLRRRFEGAETRLRLGTVTRGGKRDLQVDQTLGTRWATGGIMVAYEFDRQGRLASADRRYAASADSRPLGGSDHRSFVSTPGNILGVDPRTGTLGSLFAIPAGQNGTGLTPASFLAGATNLQNTRVDTDLIPRQQRHSGFASADQALGDAVTLEADVRYTRRSDAARLPGAAGVVTITRANPYFVSPNGTSSSLIAYNFTPELGPIRSSGVSEALASSVGLTARLGGGWEARTYGAFAQERERSRTDHTLNTSALAEAVGQSADNPSTPFRTAVDGYFNPYGTGSSNSRTILDYVGNGFSTARFRSRVWTAHVDADGTLLTLPGGAVKLAIGGDVRRESFSALGRGRGSGISTRTLYDVDGARTVEAGFAELQLPIFGPDNAMAEIRRLDLTLAGRIERYPVFGTTTNPKVGIGWVPMDGLILRGNYSTSFRAPNLRQLGDAEQVAETLLTRSDGALIPIIQLAGGNADLKPETARSWTAGFDLQPGFARGLKLSATGFLTRFRSRISTPVTDDFDNALTDPTLAPFVERLSPGSSAADLARVNALLASPAFAGTTPFPATSIGAVVDTRYVNTGEVTVSGIDFDARYTVDLGRGQLSLSASGTYLARWREKVTPASPAADRLDQVARPIHLRGRLGAGWRQGIFNGQVTLNHVAHYRDPAGARIAAWNTIDLGLGLSISKGAGWLGGTDIMLTAQNLFDRNPPFYDSPAGVGYDATNASALGRIVALQMSRRW